MDIEKLVNDEINNSHKVNIREMSLNEAKKEGIQAVFGEKYGDIVRVIDTGFSKELCGGTHVLNTKDIDKFAITSIEAKGSGIFRIEASTSSSIDKELNKMLVNIKNQILDLIKKMNFIVEEATVKGINLDCKYEYLENNEDSYKRIIATKKQLFELREVVKELSKTYQKCLQEINCESIDKYLNKVKEIKNKKICIFEVEDVNIDVLKNLVDRISDFLNESIIFVGNVMDGKVVFICKNKIDKLNAGLLVKKAAVICDGNGGGRADFAQAGGKNISKVKKALEEVLKEIEEKL